MDWHQRLGRWALRHAKTFDLFPRYWQEIASHWNEIVWGTSPLAILLFGVWLSIGTPPMALLAVGFVWALIVAGYYTWREEVKPRFKSEIVGGLIANRRLFVELRITNLGPPASVHTWQGGYKRPNGSRNWFAHGSLVSDEQVPSNSGIRGRNLKHDLRLLATGETREGWIAIDVGPQSVEESSQMLESVSLQFTDAFGDFHQIDCLATWARKPE